MPVTLSVAPTLATTLARIDADREAAYALLAQHNRSFPPGSGLGPNYGASFDAVSSAFAHVEASVAAVKAQHFGQARYRNHRLVVALGSAHLVSPTGRTSRLLWTRGGAR